MANVRQCISLLGPVHKVFIETLLQVKWTNRLSEVASAYKAFVEDLICMQIYYAKHVIDNLIEQFKPGMYWENVICVNRCIHVYVIFLPNFVQMKMMTKNGRGESAKKKIFKG